jgi:hypothetical protein
MKTLLQWLGIIFSTIGVITVVLLLIVFTHEFSGDVMYNCELAEIHPDVPTEIKQECRRLRSQKLITI